MNVFELSKEQIISYHRDMWNYISEKSLEEKRCVDKEEYLEQVFDNYGDDTHINGDCFLCEFGSLQATLLEGDYGNKCKYCPLKWNSYVNKYMCCDKYSKDDDLGTFTAYIDYKQAGDWKTASFIAKQIAELPEKE